MGQIFRSRTICNCSLHTHLENCHCCTELQTKQQLIHSRLSKMDGQENGHIPSTKQLYIRRTTYSSTLLLCLITSLGICFTMFQIFPSVHSVEENPADDVVYATVRFTISVILLFFETFAVWTVRNKEKFHTNQEVYWPFECTHCAMAVRIVSTASEKDSHSSKVDQSEPSECPIAKPENHIGTSDGTTHTLCTTSVDESEEQDRVDLTTSVTNDTVKEMKTQEGSRIHEPLYKEPHKSLLRVCNVFGVMILINMPIQFFAAVACLASSGGTALRNATLVSTLLFDLCIITGVIFSLVFFNNYYEAVFIDVAKFSYAFGIFFGTSLWVLTIKITYPVGVIIGSVHSHLHHNCNISASFMNFIVDHDDRLTPFYAEYCIVLAATIWQMWSSILPRSCLDTNSTALLSNYADTIRNASLCKSIKSCARKLKKKLTPCSCCQTRKIAEQKSLLESKSKPIHEMRSLRNKILVLLFIFSALFCAGLVILHLSLFDLAEYTRTYLRWSLKIAYSLPLVGLLNYQSFITNRSETIPVKPGISALHGLLAGHDRLLLLSCGGIFAIHIFRLIGAIDLFCRLSSVGREDIVLASYEAVFSIFRMYMFWLMTSFILIVQRQMILSVTEAKVVLTCLLYVVALNATNWLVSIAEENSWMDFQSYFGPQLGEVMGVLMEPFASLYGLHAAIIAYETYKTVYSDARFINVNKS